MQGKAIKILKLNKNYELLEVYESITPASRESPVSMWQLQNHLEHNSIYNDEQGFKWCFSSSLAIDEKLFEKIDELNQRVTLLAATVTDLAAKITALERARRKEKNAWRAEADHYLELFRMKSIAPDIITFTHGGL